MLIDSDDLHITASVVRAMADASKKGWQTLDSAASVLNEGWLGNRAEEFDDQYEALVSQAEKILKHLDEIPQKSSTTSRPTSLKNRPILQVFRA